MTGSGDGTPSAVSRWRKNSTQQKDAYTAAANACGAEWADKLAAEHGTRDPLTLCGELGLKLKTPATPAGGGQVLFAQFVQPDEDHNLH